MGLYRRGNSKIYWFRFKRNGVRIQKSTGTQNWRAAGDIENAYRTSLAKGEVGIKERKKVPTLKEYFPDFMAEIRRRSADKPATIYFWENAMTRVLEYKPIANARLDAIDDHKINGFVDHASEKVSPGTVNRRLATLRRALRIAQKSRIIGNIPEIKMVPGEVRRTFVLTPEQETAYIASAPEPLRSVAILLLETGMRVGEALALTWDDVFQPEKGERKNGHVRILRGKTKNARRNLSLTARARGILLDREKKKTTSSFVFYAADKVSPLSRFTLADQHDAVRTKLGLPKEFVIHSLRHTALTRLGAAGTDAFTIMRIAGHGSVVVSERYVHGTTDAVEMAFQNLERYNRRKTSPVRKGATPVATVATAVPQRVM
jgi:integrase